jgi:hypothetical protein
MTPEVSATFDEWLKWAFDHPVAPEVKDEWWSHLAEEDEGAKWLDRPPELALAFPTELFENPLPYLSSYSDGQINQGINFIVYRACSKHFDGLMDHRVDLGLRTKCIRSLEDLSRELFAPRCSDNAWTYAKPYTKPLDHMCHMLWDFIVREADSGRNLDGTYQIARDPEIDKEFLDTLARILAMPSIACQQSALHGLGHLAKEAQLGSNVVQQYLNDNPNLRSDLREYAQRALVGTVL